MAHKNLCIIIILWCWEVAIKPRINFGEDDINEDEII